MNTRILLFFLVLTLAANAQDQQAGRAAESYPVHADAVRQDGVPRGTVTEHRFTMSKIFPGTERDYFVYVTAQYSKEKPACLMVFNDGRGFVNEKGHSRIPIVFDNLIHRGELPVMIGVFVNPGVVPSIRGGAQPRFNRSFEYDSMGDRNARFLIEELLPEVERDYAISADPNDRGICGASSGAIGAFTAAWERPDAFRRVYSIVGTFVGLRGGNEYPVLIRKTEPKPLRVFLQDGRNDNNIYCGSWWVANQDMLAALEFSGYEVDHLWGDGYHGAKHGGAIMPDVLRWLWKDYPAPVTTHFENSRSRAPEFLEAGEHWELVSEGHEFTEGPAVSASGELFFSDLEGSKIHRVDTEGVVSVFVEESGGTNGLAFGPDGLLYGARRDARQVVAWNVEDGSMEVVADKIQPNDLVISSEGRLYVSEPRTKTVWLLEKGKERRAVATDTPCNGVMLSADQTLLHVADYGGRFVYSFQVAEDGTLRFGQEFSHLHVPANAARSEADGMAMTTEGWLLVATAMGIQVCDQPGRVNFIMPPPTGARHAANVIFGGADRRTLYATCGDKVFRRRVKLTGVDSWRPPVDPGKPRL